MNYTALYQQYFTVDSGPNSNGFIKVQCCFPENHANQDSRESASFNVDNGVYHCSVCGSKSVYGFLKDYKGMTYSQAEEHIKSVLGMSDREVEYSKNKPRDFSDLETKIIYDIEKLSIAKAYAERTGTSIETLKELGVGYLTARHTNWNQASLCFPYTVNGKVVGLRYRNIYGAKGGEDGSVLVPWGIDRLDPSKPTIIVEGDTDRVSATHFFKDLIDVNVVSTPTSHFSEAWARFFENTNAPIIVIPQDDVPGKKLVSSVKDVLGKERVFVCKIPFGRKTLGKDLTDWLEDNPPQDIIRKFKHKLDTKITNLIVTAREFAHQVEASQEEEFIITNLLYPSSVTIVAGKQKSFKTWGTLSLIRSIIGSTTFGKIPQFTGNAPACNILYLQGEGSERKFNERLLMALYDTPYKDRLYIGYKTGHRLDSYESVEKLLSTIIDLNINLLVIDPLQRFSKLMEDSATENADLWDNINFLLNGKPGLSIVILMHFSKNGKATDKWDAIRGTSRHGGEADLGLFFERVDKDSVKVVIDGRDYSAEQEIFMLRFENGQLIYEGDGTTTTGEEELKVYENVLAEVKKVLVAGAKEVDLASVCKTYDIKAKFFKIYIDQDPDLILTEGGGRGKKATITLKPSE
jgi:hypothetical protein